MNWLIQFKVNDEFLHEERDGTIESRRTNPKRFTLETGIREIERLRPEYDCRLVNSLGEVHPQYPYRNQNQEK